MASCDNDVVGAEVCLVSQIPGHTNVSAEAGIPARTYHNTALITVQRNTHVCVLFHTHTYKCMCVCSVCVCVVYVCVSVSVSETVSPCGHLAVALEKIR